MSIRIHEELRQPEDSFSAYKQVLNYDSSNTEAVACVAAHFFHTGQPEWALVLYKSVLAIKLFVNCEDMNKHLFLIGGFFKWESTLQKFCVTSRCVV